MSINTNCTNRPRSGGDQAYGGLITKGYMIRMKDLLWKSQNAKMQISTLKKVNRKSAVLSILSLDFGETGVSLTDMILKRTISIVTKEGNKPLEIEKILASFYKKVVSCPCPTIVDQDQCKEER